MDSKSILERAKSSLGLSSDGELAAALGVNKSTLSNWKTRNSIDYDTLFSRFDNTDLNYLLRGVNPIEELANRMSWVICAMSLLSLEEIASFFDVSGIELGNFTNNINLPKNAFNYTKFLKAFPEINSQWLIFGIGNMYNKGFSEESLRKRIYEEFLEKSHELIYQELGIQKPNKQKPKAHPVQEKVPGSIPLIPFSAFAGYGSESFQDLVVEDYYIVKEFKDADFLIRVKGDSMTPKYNGGDVLACKKIDAVTFWQWHKVYAICTRNQGILIKRVEEYPNNPAFITLKSENPIYHPFELHEDEIISVAIVLGAIVLE